MNKKLVLGIKLALLTSVISGVAGFVNKVAVTNLPALLHTSLKNSLVFVFLFSVILVTSKAHTLRNISGRDRIRLILIGIVGGSLPFYLFFSALARMSVVNAMLVHKTLIFWVALLAIPILREKITKWHITAMVILFGSNLIIGGIESFSFSMPTIMVFGATILWAIENVIAKIVLRKVHPLVVAGSRMGIGSLILLIAASLSGQFDVVGTITSQQWAIVSLSSVLLFGYVVTWYSALKYAPVVTVASVLVSSTVITNILSALFVTRTLDIMQLLQIGVIIFGTVLIAYATFKKSSRTIGHQVSI